MEDDSLFVAALGLFMIYSMVHFFVIQFTKTWKARTSYEKFLTIAAATSGTLILIGLSSN